MGDGRIGFRGRLPTFTLAVGVTAGMLVAGLGFPFIFGHAQVGLAGGGSTQLNFAGEGPGEGPGAGPGAGSAAAGSSASGANLGASSTGGTSGGGASSLGALGTLSGPGGGSSLGGPGGSSTSLLGGPTTGPVATLAGGRTLTASDRGVTATGIKVGVTILDLGGVGQLGVSLPGYSPAHQEQIWTGYFNELNKKGGIYGRKVQPVFQDYDITNDDSMQAACIALAQDDKVFAVLDTSGFMGAPLLCLTQQNATPVLTVGELGTPDSFYSESNGYLFTLHARGSRQMKNMATVIARTGALKGKTVGVLAEQGLGFDQTYATLQSTLASLGYPETYQYELSSDTGTAASQMPVAVSEMLAHHVNAVFLTANLIFDEEFADAAQAEDYAPSYFTSDWGTGENISGAPSSFNGALAVTETDAFDWNEGLPQPTYDAQCQQRGTADSGYVWDASNSESVNHPADMRDCSLVDLFTRAATQAGPDLTRAGFVAAMQRLGNVPVATFPPYGTFGPGKPDAADFVRIDQYQSNRNCGAASTTPGCFYPVTQFVKAPY
jgi:ABC-type branched-subunit amino acid transport system substrate-binding protein